MKQIAVVMILLNISYGHFSRSQSVDIDEPHTYTPPRHYFQTSSFDEAELEADDVAKNPLDRGPYFDISASRNVTALVGNTAYLNCRVRNLGNRTVSWIRHRDLHLLTVGKATYTSDQRYQSVHNPQLDDWSLKVLYPQQRDSGVYECQISTTPPVGYSMTLSVVEPITTVVGGPDLYIDTGSTVNLTCIVKHLPEPPPVIQWTHNGEEINYDSPRGGVSVITEKGDITTSYLLIQRARSSDSGKYTCLPSTANPMTVHVHVLNGEHPAAIQGAKGLRSNNILPFVLLLLVLGLRTFPVR
ncbi:zwei Ig domain protein zig-8-like [Anopheles ziemanni]|uniref:zwei Ig domain protein zig-8-like n=1 Tax=Anopheles coustani TaxID=139045 RepID=UPI002658D8FC|nr:zwei Ig domain protein zig-8-like [Anopheles coustani]XP_058177170.1 zwei Ig domain protein zig-8-like [Anopheles ziemanni]